MERTRFKVRSLLIDVLPPGPGLVGDFAIDPGDCLCTGCTACSACSCTQCCCTCSICSHSTAAEMELQLQALQTLKRELRTQLDVLEAAGRPVRPGTRPRSR